MRIAICVKAVPDTETKIALAADKKNIDFTGVRFIASPYDEFAIEEALKTKEKLGGDTTVFSLGGAECTDVLRDSLARGIDNAVHLSDADFVGLDTLSTAKALAAALKDGGFDIVFVGHTGSGGDNSQVPSMLAELLGWAQTTMVVKFETDGKTFRAEREIEGAHEIIEGTLPVVISTQKGLNEPRYPGIKGVMAARRKEIAVKDASALGLKGVVGGDKIRVRIREMLLPPERPQGKKIEGDPDAQVKELVSLLRSEAHVL